MSPSRRVIRASAAAAVVVVFATSCLYLVVRTDVSRLDRQRIDRPASQALLSVQHLMASVDQILATANGVVASSGLDPHRFAEVLGPNVSAKSTLAGMALIAKQQSGGASVVARIGDTHLLDRDGRRALLAGADSTLVAFRHEGGVSDLGFAATAANGAAFVFLEVALPSAAAPGAAFALVTPGPSSRVVLSSGPAAKDLVPWNQAVSFAGRRLELLVVAGASPPGLLGLSLPNLVLLVGAALTALAAAIGALVARRDAAVRNLGIENRLLDQSLEQQRIIAAELRASEERFRTILRDSPDSIVLLDAVDGSSEILNRADFFGHSPEALAGADGLYSTVHADDRREADAFWQRMRELAPEQICETNLRVCDAAGDTRHVRLRFSPLATADIDPAESQLLLGAVADVTEQWNNEEREGELEEALRRSQRLESVGQLAGGVAHDFNNLLAAILASAELLEDHVPDGRPREYTDEIQRSAMRGAALVRQLLTFAQRDRAELQVIDLNHTLSGMEPLLRRSLGEHVQLQVTMTDCSTEVVADPTHVEQVILNLAVNARDAMPNGGVLWIATAIAFDDEDPQNDRVVLSVTDTGIGIPAELRERMFEPFVTTKAPGEGTGLGLSTVQSLVAAMQGRIEVLTKVGEGTTFEISLARRFGEIDPADQEAPAQLIEGAGRRILLVEDEPAVRTALAHRLRRLDFVVTTATNGAEALEFIERRTFDLVLTDAVMPGISGPDLIDHLRAARPELRVLLMSGYTPGQTVADDRSNVVRLRKPFTTLELTRALSLALDDDTIERTST